MNTGYPRFTWKMAVKMEKEKNVISLIIIFIINATVCLLGTLT